MKIKNYFLLILLFASTTFFSKAGTTTTYTINVNGTTRTFIVYVPTIYDGSKPVPLMLNIHGYTMSDASQQNMMNFDPVADTANFIVARPRGLNNAWSQATTVSAGQADRNFIWNMIDSLKSWYNINPCKIYSAGFSQGSFMSQILVLNVDNPSRAPVIAAIGSSSGGISKSGNPSYWTAKNPTHPVPVLHLHGTSDGTISYDGGGTQNPASVDELMNFWVTHNNCNTTATMTTCGSIDHYIWDGGDRGTRVELYKVNGGSHSAPNNTCMNSAKTIWEFCRPYCLPYLTSTTCTDVPTISGQPASQTITTGNSTTFAVTANGCVGTALTYQWQVNSGSGFTNLTNAAPYSGVTTGTLTVTSATTGLNTYQYRCFVGSCCYDVYSSSATLTVTSGCTAPTITGTTPASRCDAGTVTLAATASAGTINWYAASTGGSSLGTGASYTTPTISSTTTYYVDATDNGCTSSRTAVVATHLTPPGGCMAGNQTICSGALATISVTLNGDAPWDFNYSIDNIDQTQVTVTSSPYTVTVTTAGDYQISHLSNSTGCAAIVCASFASITENTAITVSTETVTCDGANANYTVEFDISGGDAASYTVDGSAANIVSSHYTSAAITSGSSYSLTVTDSYNCSPVIVSGTKTCASNCNATAAISGDATICSGTSTVVSIDLTGTAPWSVTYAIDANNQTPVTTSSSTYTFTTSAAGVYSLASVTDGNSCTATKSGSATITERTPLSVSTATVTCDGSNANYTVEFDISGGDAASYTVNGSAVNIVSSHFTSSAIASGSSYSLTVNDVNNCSPVIVSGTKTCGIACNATADISGDATICSGTSATISIALTGTAPWSVTYAIGGLSQTPITTTSSTYTFTTSTAGIYTLASVSDGNSCTAITSGSATVNVNTAITISNKTETCNGGNTDYIVEFDISGGDGIYTVEGSSANIVSSHYTGSAIVSGSSYSLTVTDSYNCSPVTVTGTKTCGTVVVCNATASISGDATICAGATTTISIALTGTAPWSITYAKDGTNQTPATATSSPYTFATGSGGVYTLVSVTDGNSCSAVNSGSATITVNPLPTVSTVSNPSSAAVCIGSTVTLSGTGAVNYFWSGGISDGIAFVPSVGSTTYTVSGTDANNCSNTATRVVTAYPLPAVVISASPASVSVCAGSTVILIGTGAASYSWSTGSTTSAITLVPAITETITVTGTDANSCTNTATKIVTVENCNPGTGIEENTSLPSFSVYPNPTGGMLNISISNASGAEVITSVINVFGTEVFSNIEKNIPADHTKQINLGDLTKGMYYIKLNIDGDIQIKKLVIQ